MGGDLPATIQSLHEISFKSYKGWHIQPLSIHRSTDCSLSWHHRGACRPHRSRTGISKSCMLLLARGSAWPESSQRSSLLPNRLRQPLIETSWQCCRSGQTAVVPKVLRQKETLSASILLILWLRFTSTLLVVGRINNSGNAVHRSSRIHRHRLEVRGAARRTDHEHLRRFQS